METTEVSPIKLLPCNARLLDTGWECYYPNCLSLSGLTLQAGLRAARYGAFNVPDIYYILILQSSRLAILLFVL